MIPDVDNDSIVYLNGDYVRLGDAKVSVLDRGFVFGDGIYEVVPVYNGKPFRMAEHIARLQRSLKAIRIDTGYSDARWAQLFEDMILRTQAATAAVSDNVMIYLQVTRGVAKRDHAFPAGITPTVFCMVSPFKRPTAAQRDQGLATIALPDVRWLYCHIKSVSLLGNVLAKQAAVEAGVDEVIQFRDNFLSEGASSNIWVVKNGILLAPEPNHLILEGVRYRFIEALAQKAGVVFESRPVSRQEVETADELMLSSATKEILPIVMFDGRPVGTGVPGPVYRVLRAAYDQTLEAL